METLDRIAALTQREEHRQLDLRKKKEVKESTDAVNERLGVFQALYEAQRKEIEAAIDASENVAADSLPEHFASIYKNIQALQKYVATSNVFLRVYDIQKSNVALLELTNKTTELEEKLLPKKKFGFKKRKAISAVINGVSKDEVDCSKKEVGYGLSLNICGFRNRTNENLTLNATEIAKKDLTAQNLTNCTVRFLGNASTLHCSNLTDCILLSGPISTSIFAENCVNCTLVVACQQLRLHNSKNIKIYLHVTSRGILEDCKDVQVAPYNLSYESLDEDFKNSGLDINSNHWDELNDFNWLNVDKHSPNWSILEEEQRTQTWENFLNC